MLSLPSNEDDFTEIVELPAIVVNNEIKMSGPKMAILSSKDIKDLAFVMGGTAMYIKLRATLSTLETQFCVTKDCWRPACSGEFYCGDHT